MKKFFTIIAWGFVFAIGGVILFVKAPGASNGQSGGEQASKIIQAGGGALSAVVTSLEGGG